MPIITRHAIRQKGRLALAVWFGTTASIAIGAAPANAARTPSEMTAAPSGPKVATRARTLSSAEPTRSLFRYIRADNSPNSLTTVEIDAAEAASHPIDRRVFGNFIEHLGGVIYDGLWANALHNPNLERIEPNDSAPPAWQLEGDAVWRDDGYFSPRCVALGNSGRLRQRTLLPQHRTLHYTLTLWGRAPQGNGRIAVSLNRYQASTSLTSTTAAVDQPGWKRIEIHFTLPGGVLKKAEPTQFVIAHAGGSRVEVDQIELFPDDNIEGMDPDVLRRAHAWHMPLVRYPGGNFVSGYNWRDGVGPRAKRPTLRNPAWGGVESNHYGTDEFMRFCRILGVEPHFTLNAGNGTPQEAAAWVRYCNDPADRSPEAKERAANGHMAPYGIHIWEVGNELYGGWQIGHTDGPGNAECFVRFRDAVLKADPTIKLIATGKGDEFTPEGWARCRDWNERLLRASAANGGKAPDYLSIHPLMPLPGILPNLSYADEYESAMAQPELLGALLLPDLADLIKTELGPDAPTKIAPTEWGIIAGGERWQQGPNHDALAGAIFNALTLNAMLRNSDIVNGLC